MSEFQVIGGNKLYGEIGISGAKNSILPILAGSILNKNECIIENVPKLTDTYVALEILTHLGCTCYLDGSTLVVNSIGIVNREIPFKLIQKMRSSIIFLGSLISLFGYCKLCYPGGCNLGKRPIDLHISNLKKLGIKIDDDGETLICYTNKIVGTNLNLTFPSVGATENLILASVFNNGSVNIINPAKEPEITDLQNFLNSMGCKVNGAGTNCITIRGVIPSTLKANNHRIIPDRIVAGTYLVAGAITEGAIILNKININHLNSTLNLLSRLGFYVKKYEKEGKVFLSGSNKKLSIPLLETSPHPGFHTDMQSQVMSLLCISNGVSNIRETLFEARNMNVPQLNNMGANIITKENQISQITGVEQLRGATVYASDLRGGASLILAGLVAEGKTIIKNPGHILRGYENIAKDLTALNGNVKFIK